MENLQEILEESLNINFVRAVISNPRVKEGILKVKVRPIEKQGELYF